MTRHFWLAAWVSLSLAACGGSAPTAPATASKPTPTPTPTPTPPPVVSTCSGPTVPSLVQPGSYTLTSDLNCALPIGSSGVHLDCGNHTVSSLKLTDAISGVVITNCTINAQLVGNGQASLTLDHDVLPGGVSLTAASNFTVSNSHLSGPLAPGPSVLGGQGTVNLVGATFARVSDNVVDHVTGPYGIALIQGGHNQALRNVVDGGYRGDVVIGNAPGDDGIIVSQESNDTIDGNTVSNVYDAGIEGVWDLTSTMITNNVVANAATAAVGSYYCTAWNNNTITGNSLVSGIGAFMRIEYNSVTVGCPTQGSFVNNTITNNNTRGAFGAVGAVIVLPPPATVSNNLLQNNDFGVARVSITPLSGFVDGGGNTCATGGSFVCANTSSVR